MKIGILTHTLGYNYGGLLQNFALQQVLIKLGHEPITLNHQPIQQTKFRKILSICKRCLYRIKGKSLPIIGYPTVAQWAYITRFINEFKNRCINKSNPVLLNSLNEVNDIDTLQALIVGSDQVWRYKMMGNEIIEMFLFSFQNIDIKRISYAASFGNDVWEMPEVLTMQVKFLLNKFDSISVREESAIKMCKKKFGVNAKLVLDPTMLLSAEEYIHIIKTSPFNHVDKPNSLMIYVLDRNIEKTKIIDCFINESKLTKNELYPKSKFANVGKKYIDECVFPPVEEWLKGFKDAEMVITDSFHGTVFSIIFNKPFWVIGNEKRGMARFNTLLSLFNLKNRLITVVPKNIYEPVDWDIVNNRLHTLKQESINFLKDSLK